MRWVVAVGVLTVIGAVGAFVVSYQSGSMLVDAVYSGDASAVVRLIEQGHDVNDFGKDDWTPLTVAVEKDDVKLVELLLKNGADPNMTVPGGTALDMAVRRGRERSADVLRKFGGRCATTCGSGASRGS